LKRRESTRKTTKRKTLNREATSVELRRLGTEKTNSASVDLDRKSALEIARIINAEDAKVAAAVKGALRQIAEAIDLIAAALAQGGRLIYVGTGTSGRIAALDAVECPPTFDVDPRMVQFIIAGGPRALGAAVEADEDSRELGRKEIAKKKPTGHGFMLPNEYGEAPMNLVFSGGKASLEEMIASTDRGLLVTRLWYIREVDPYEKVMTGMTRDGLFLVEKGRVASAVRNFRFNQSILEMLRNVEMMGPAVRGTGEEAFEMVVPAMKVRDFRFSEVTKF